MSRFRAGGSRTESLDADPRRTDERTEAQSYVWEKFPKTSRTAVNKQERPRKTNVFRGRFRLLQRDRKGDLKRAEGIIPAGASRSGERLVPTAATATAAAATATAAVATAAAATITATAAAITAAAAAATAATVFTRTSFVDCQRSAFMLLRIQGVDRRLSLGRIAHFHEAKSLAPPCVAILNYLRTFHLAILREQRLETLARDTVAQIADIQTRSHRKFLRTEPTATVMTFRAEKKGTCVAIHPKRATKKCGEQTKSTARCACVGERSPGLYLIIPPVASSAVPACSDFTRLLTRSASPTRQESLAHAHHIDARFPFGPARTKLREA
jgi:hypothetical protein